VPPITASATTSVMLHLPKTNLRVRLIAAIILTTLPLMALIWYGAQRQFVRESEALEQEVQRLNTFIAGDVAHLLEATRQMLIAVAEITRTVGPASGEALLNDLAERSPFYASFAAVNPAGRAAGTNLPPWVASQTINSNILRRAAMSRELVVASFRAKASDNRNSLGVAYCIADESNATPPVVSFVLLDLAWLDELLKQAKVTGEKSLFPRSMVLNIIDRSGIILTRYPDTEKWSGKKLPDTQVLREILSKGEGTADLTGVDGLSRYYAFQSVKSSSGELFVCVGVSCTGALASAKHDQHRNLAAVSAVGLLLILVAWFGTGIFISRPVASLVQTTQRLGAGDLSARTGITRGPQEITHLAETFDRMATTLQHDACERDAMQTKLADYDRQLRTMTVETALAEEQERRQIAAGLHDKAGPLLATCYMKLGRVLKLPLPPEATATLGESRDLIDQTIAELRTLTFDLSSPTLYTLGLTAAVDELCRETAKHHALAITFRDQGTPLELPNDQRVVLYQATRELLFNVVKHAEATKLTVTCSGDAAEVFVSVTDNGVGFNAADAGRGVARTGGFGLFNLRERLTHLGGYLTVESSRGAGTRALAALPVRPHEK